ncbi:helix-turn-helix transcriptional regulator [Phytomonospora endophytica]|uniref:DNA-binding CsgD family transcriptional regulator n=1 Tax=Phytomonospora endophytica TaxID=714109 RepID=A0A841FN16_9ACTN|nr:LuxR family transcriptional regulator [Phytomonospora endophytica]MBB6033999.1 DNA-binding CsgD family transcriptional regulator [Phytomonospora endophytica]GIG64480.1 LuxR family transcriptional regulator [Phytomonospora endophytica]
MLFGRPSEIARLDRLVDAARDGHSAALVLRGEAGIGKSALLDHCAAHADGFTLLRSSGAEFESELPYAGLHLLLREHVGRIGSLPEPQAAALRAALGLAADGDREWFLVGLAVLSLLTELAEDAPVLCLVDDVHWLDHETTAVLRFVARRLQAEGVVMILTARDSHAPAFAADGIDELTVSPLDDDASGEVLAAHAADLPGYVRDLIRAESSGNPLALRELAAAQREGHLGAETAGIARLPTHGRIQRSFGDRIAALPQGARNLLLIAAADDTRSTTTVLAAAERLGATLDDLDLVESRDLLRPAGEQLLFRHPLIRAAAYQGAATRERAAAHEALATVLDAQVDGYRRAWHLAAATTGTDETVAALLEAETDALLTRGGYAAVTSGYARAAALSPLPAERGRRFLAAARTALDAGQLDRADALADQAARNLADEIALAHVARVRGSAANWRGSPAAAHRIWSDAALRVAPHSQDNASYLLFNAAELAWLTGDFPAAAEDAERAAALGLRNADRVAAIATTAAGINGRAGKTPADGLDALRRMLGVVHTGKGPTALADGTTVVVWHLMLGDHVTGLERAEDLVARCRARGALGVLPRALGLLARARLYSGAHGQALDAATEGVGLAKDIGSSALLFGVPASVLAYLAAIEGDEERCTRLMAEILAMSGDRAGSIGEGPLALLDLGLGRFEAAHERLSTTLARPHRLDLIPYVPDLVESATRLNGPPQLGDAFELFESWATATGMPWARAVVTRCRALLDDANAEEHFTEALATHALPGDRPFEAARTTLLYGEWLRRRRRVNDAKPHLRQAAEAFARFRATVWADRARLELRAAGDSVTAQAPGPDDPFAGLTPQESQVVRLAADGLTNREIGAQLFLSPRTVGYHLYKAYPKLGVASRAELGRLPRSGGG